MSAGMPAGTTPAAAAVRRERTRILSALLDGVPGIASRAIEAMRAEIPAYAAQDESFFADVRDQIVAHYRTKLAALLEDREATLDDIAFTRRAAMRRARAGIALTDYINAFRVGQQVFWEEVLRRAGESRAGHDAALTLAAPLMRYCDLASSHAGQAYVEFRQYAVADEAQEKRDLLDALIAGEMPERGPLLATARAHGMRPKVRMSVLVALPTGPDADVDARYVAGSAIAAAGLHGVPTLTVVRRGEIVAVPVLPAGTDPRPICDRLQAVRDRLRHEGIPLAMGLGTIVRGAAELPRAYQEARTAIGFLPGDGGFVALPRLSAFEYLALTADSTADHLVDPGIRTLLEEDRSRGGVLIATIREFARADLNLRATARRLQIHHNTAQYRLRRIQERSGRNPRRISDLLDLLVAIALQDRKPAS